MAKLPHNIQSRFTLNHINLQIRPVAGHLQQILPGVADIKPHKGGIIKKQAHQMAAGKQQEIMSSIHGTSVLMMMGIIAAVTLINKSPLIDSSVGAPKAVNPVLVRHFIGKGKSVFRYKAAKIRQFFSLVNRLHHSIRIKGVTESKSGNHDSFLLMLLFRRRDTTVPPQPLPYGWR